MSIRRMMLFSLGAKIKNLIDAFKARVFATQGEFEAEACLDAQLTQLDNQSLLDNASLIVTPNGYREGQLFNVVPSDGKNILLQSQNFNTSPWIKLGSPNVTVVENTAIAPDGTNTASLITSNNNGQFGIRQTVVIEPNTSYRLSFWARSTNSAVIRADVSDQNLQTINLTSTWTRYSINGSYNLSYAYISQFVDIVFDSNQLSKTFELWGAQLEVGTVTTDYQSNTTTRGGFQVTRATTATRVNADGFIEQVPYNLFQRSEEFENGYWTKQRTSITQNTIMAPNGTMTADNLIATSGVTYLYIGPNGVNVVSNSFTQRSLCTVSFYLKYNGLNRIRVMYGGATTMSGGNYVEVDLQLGIITNSDLVTNPFIQNVGDGWYRVGFTDTITSATNNRFGVGLGDTVKTIADGVDGVYIWGAQLVDGSLVKDYFPTTNGFNVPRIDYSNGSCPSILVEPQRTNLILQSEDFTTGWSLEGTSITSNNQTAPDNLPSADTLSELGITDVHRTYRSAVTVTANALYTTSFFVKKNNIRYVRLVLTQNASTTIWAGAQFDLDTQTFTSQVGTGGGVFTSATITPFANGWFRISVVGSIPSTLMIPMLVLSNGSTMLNTDTRGCPIYLGNTSNSLFIWGAQLELGPNATSYIPTVASTVTRNADVISNTNASTLIGQTEGTIFVEFVPKVVNSDIIRMTEDINTFNNGFFIFINTPGNLQCSIRANGVTSANHIIPVNISNTPIYKVAIKYSSGNTKIFVNGILRITNTTVYTFSVPVTRIQMDNAQWTSNNQTRAITNVSLWKTQITDAQAIQLTTL
jgi:hypothetical protein